MSRPLRIEFPGALNHVTARGDSREDIFVDDADRPRLLALVAQGLGRFGESREEQAFKLQAEPDARSFR